EAARELARLRPQLQESDRAAAEARKLANSAERSHLDALRQRLEGMASHLARSLEPGSPCAVCGSTEHPGPAATTADTVTDAQLEKLEAQREELEEAAQKAESGLAEMREAMREHEIGAGPFAADPAGARSAAEKAEKRLAEANTRAD